MGSNLRKAQFNDDFCAHVANAPEKESKTICFVFGDNAVTSRFTIRTHMHTYILFAEYESCSCYLMCNYLGGLYFSTLSTLHVSTEMHQTFIGTIMQAIEFNLKQVYSLRICLK